MYIAPYKVVAFLFGIFLGIGFGTYYLHDDCLTAEQYERQHSMAVETLAAARSAALDDLESNRMNWYEDSSAVWRKAERRLTNLENNHKSCKAK